MFRKSDEYNSIYAAAQIKLELLPPNKRDANNIAKIVDESIKWITSSNFPYRDKIIKQLTTNFTITSSKSSILSDSDDHQPWYFKEQLLNRKYWESYRDYLKTDKQYSMDGVNSIDETTDKIMSLMENPKRDGPWDVRGLVVGSVQSENPLYHRQSI